MTLVLWSTGRSGEVVAPKGSAPPLVRPRINTGRTVHEVLDASAHGDVHRRCYQQKAPAEIKAVMRSVNSLLDGRVGAVRGK